MQAASILDITYFWILCLWEPHPFLILITTHDVTTCRLPQFWKHALCGHPMLRQVFSDLDLEVLDYLTQVNLN